MARHPSFDYQKTPRGWMVNCPASLSATHKRERHYFTTRDKAKEHAASLREKALKHGRAATAIRPSLAEAAAEAEAILAPWGLSLVEAVRMAAAIRERETASKPLGEAADLWLLSCEGLRPKTQHNYKLTADRLRNELADRLLASITAEELQAAVAPLGNTGAAAAERVRNTKAFWNWCAKKGWCEAKTFGGVEMPAANNNGEIEFLTVGEAEALLRTAETHFPQAAASYALQLFSGIRVWERKRLEGGHVTEDGVSLGGEVTKKGYRRHVNPSDTLGAWLERWPYESCPNWTETDCAVRRLAGWDVVSVILNARIAKGTMQPLPEPHRGRWPQNALRHTHATYSVAAGVPLERLLFEFGHAGTPALLRQRYAGRTSKKAALQYFAIVPTPEAGQESAKIQNIKIA